MLPAVRCPQNPPGTVAYAAGLKGEPSTFVDDVQYTASNCTPVATVEIQISPRLATCCIGAALSGTKRLLGEVLSASRYGFRGKGRGGTRTLRPFPLNLS